MTGGIDDWLNPPEGLPARLLVLRKRAGLTGREMAAALGWRQSKISKIETGRQVPSEEDVRLWVRATVDDGELERELLAMLAEQRTIYAEWRHRMKRGQVGEQLDHDQLTRSARRIRSFENVIVPGLLQTPGYARALITESATMYGTPADEVEAAVGARMRRQETLYVESKTFQFVIFEAALRTMPCPPDAMRAQLDRLLMVTELANIELSVIPFGERLPITPYNSFIIFDDELVVIESFGGETVHRGEPVAFHATVMDALAAEAWAGDRARNLILRAATDL